MVDYYDAFGGKISEVEEVWAGDSFNRNGLSYCCAVDDISNATAKCIGAEPATLSFTVKDTNWNKDALDQIAYGKNVANNVTLCIDDIQFNSEVDSIKGLLDKLQEQINELKATSKADNKLRVELRTLKYVREVE